MKKKKHPVRTIENAHGYEARFVSPRKTPAHRPERGGGGLSLRPGTDCLNSDLAVLTPSGTAIG